MIKIEKIKTELAYYRALTIDPRTPLAAKWLIAAALAYLLMPFDLIPDFIPVLGQLDDLIIVPSLVWLGLRCIPLSLKQEIRRAVEKAHKSPFSE